VLVLGRGFGTTRSSSETVKPLVFCVLGGARPGRRDWARRLASSCGTAFQHTPPPPPPPPEDEEEEGEEGEEEEEEE
jgi:hypothetical protein